jgi:hypothetical protein
MKFLPIETLSHLKNQAFPGSISNNPPGIIPTGWDGPAWIALAWSITSPAFPGSISNNPHGIIPTVRDGPAWIALAWSITSPVFLRRQNTGKIGN